MADTTPRLGVYIHIPFCASKCKYCDFCSLAGKENLMPHYQNAVLIQLQETMPQLEDRLIDSVYFGGGTPSYYGASRLRELLREVKYTNRLLKTAEITVECNPDSVRTSDLSMLRREGVNRLSIGAQSANDELLKLIGRRHDWRQVEMAVRRARKAGFKNISLDLIYGLPTQTREDWADTLAKAVALNPSHLSCYGLRLEEGTPLYDEYNDSPLLPSDDEQADMYLYAVDWLGRHGYHQYEVSNFARPGFESRHNLKYWRLGDYVGFGASAASNMGLSRWTALRNVRDYVAGMLEDKDILAEREDLTSFDRAAEYLMLGLRTTRGISGAEYTRIWRSNFAPVEEVLSVFAENGWAVHEPNGRWHFTPGGFLVSNTLIGLVLEAQTKEKFNANPWVRQAFEEKGELIPLPKASEPYLN